MTSMKVTESHTTTRGPESWNYIYFVLGFALTIEGTICDMVPLPFPWNLIAFVIVGAITFWLFIESGWFQNKLIGWKAAYEQRAR